MFGWIGSVVCGAKDWICEKASDAFEWGCEKASDAYEWGCEKMSDACDYVKEKGSALYCGAKRIVKDFTGQTTAEEAKRRLEKLERTARRRQSEYESQASEIAEQINGEVKKINKMRDELGESLFRRFEKTASAFANWSVCSVSGEGAVCACLPSLSIRSEASLIKIDFDKHPIMENAKAFITLGFVTRKAAKESLYQVMEEEERMKAVYADLDVRLENMRLTCEALKEVSKYMSNCLKWYRGVLDELDYSVRMLRSARRVMSSACLNARFDIEFLPARHLTALKCADKATRILYEIAAKRYVRSSKNGIKLMADDQKRFSELKREFAVVEDLAIAA